jgi:hypothetical protein
MKRYPLPCFFWIFPLALAAATGCGTGDTDPPDASMDGGSTPRDPILDGGGEIPPPPNGANLCPTGVCNYQTQSGCSPDGGPVSCVPLPAGSGVAPACERAGSRTAGATCSQWTDCAPGMICADNKCRKLCCGRDWTGCGTSAEHCLRPLEILVNNAPVTTNAFLCYPVNVCDALVPASCGSVDAADRGTTCQIANPTGATACLPEGVGGVGSTCPISGPGCKGGFTCVEGGCRRLCRAVAGGGEPSCPVEEGICVHFNRDPPGVGECTPI